MRNDIVRSDAAVDRIGRRNGENGPATADAVFARLDSCRSFAPGRPTRCDYEYERNGTANLFMMFAPLEGWRHVEVTDRHTAVDCAQVLKDLVHVHFASAKTIVLAQDNLNIHGKVSLPLSGPEAERLTDEWVDVEDYRRAVKVAAVVIVGWCSIVRMKPGQAVPSASNLHSVGEP